MNTEEDKRRAQERKEDATDVALLAGDELLYQATLDPSIPEAVLESAGEIVGSALSVAGDVAEGAVSVLGSTAEVAGEVLGGTAEVLGDVLGGLADLG